LESGARQTIVNFSEGFDTCTVDVTYHHAAGAAAIVLYGMDNQLRVIESVGISSQSCTITDGNIFGEGN